ncbi:unnamed protein product [Paramecium sonneborni]|uniref:Uncharacterized protein n=1 Tax=Paramecium sonneborni TaxID=65129 RepID=A0A8S1RSH5_9CILI|nr:unnamed protein product [Paramecium sonneborni]
MEYMDEGSLSYRLQQVGNFNQTVIRIFTIQIQDRLIYLHRQAEVYRRADFGSSQWKEVINLSDTEFRQSIKEQLFFQMHGSKIIGERKEIWKKR